jgi:type II secretory pathway component PulJ
MKGGGGFTLLESLVVVLLSALLVQGGWAVFATLWRGGERVGEISEGLETVRTVAWLLEEEVSGGLPGRDWWPGGGDTLPLRAYRGLALVDGRDAAGQVLVCYRGIRNPNPEKDSVLFLGGDGSWRPHALLSRVRGDAGCMGGGEGWREVWRVEPEPGETVLGRVFERGSYHLTGGAFRYRRGAGGRQPLTPLRVAEGSLDGDGASGGGLLWALRLSWSGPGGDTLLWSGRIR